MAPDELQALVTELHGSLQNEQLDQALALLSRSKLALLQLNALIPTSSTPPRLFSLAREILELGAITSIRRGDAPSFTRYYQQLQPFYDIERHIIATQGNTSQINVHTSQRSKITGLYLLLLLSMGNNTDFHTVLEGLVEEASIQGRIVWRETKLENVPSPDFGLFSDILIGTIRSEIADCSEKAYPSLPISNIKNLLFFNSEGAVIEFAKERGWTLKDGRVYFPTQEEQTDEDASQSEKQILLTGGNVIENAIGYARQLETIV
ncbi:26S proteasome non-ATPase regulatory subunit 8 [Coccidioides immitis RMSCC 3703]|uniref:26S proteasome non-ATPase regulatory subunit 8 n=1 Tax=Coccidioides immitis RMSCC 3703 TaxID=454286 RepID=A0A0J8R5V2_COCIT|nr:26S proteasome non-ATPase regulatory subunit 8 [Coccidioides immitis RMSCC 3703]